MQRMKVMFVQESLKMQRIMMRVKMPVLKKARMPNLANVRRSEIDGSLPMCG